jgi:membrane associated rhomboid family serine protease
MKRRVFAKEGRGGYDVPGTMGIYSRDYLRRDDGLRGKIVLYIIGLTIAAYVVQGVVLGRGEIDLAQILGVVPEKIVRRGWLWQLVTHALLHQPTGITHLAFNMLFLYWLGTDVADIYGVRRFLFLYLGGAVSCALAYTAVAYGIGKTDVPAIGASGAIMAVSVVAAFLFPSRTVLFMWVLPMPLWVLVSLYVGLDLYYPLAGLRSWLDSAGHLGGALFGFVCHRFHLDAPSGGRFLSSLRSLMVPAAPPSAEVDRILDKINAQGIGSLTDGERELLKRASKDR